MPTIDQVLASMGSVLKGLTKDVGDLKSQVNKLRTLESGGYYLPFTNYNSLGAGIAVTSSVFMTTIPRQIVLRSWKQTWHMASGDISNYWTVRLQTQAGVHYTFTTQPANGAAATWNRYDTTGLSLALLESYRYVFVDAVKTGTPGVLYLACPAVYVF